MNNPPMLGAHFSVAGGLENALTTAAGLDCQAAQIFTKNSRSWAEPHLSNETISRFKEARRETGVKFIASHCSYLINIANPDPGKRDKSAQSLLAEMMRSSLLGIDAVVLHPGAHLGKGKESGLETAKQSLVQVLSNDDDPFPRLLLETTAGTGTSLGSRFEELGWLISSLSPAYRTGICLDTSHVFAAGYDLRSVQALNHTLDLFEKHIGLSHLHLLHLNDSKTELGSFRDRHEHIGMGCIGKSGFSAILSNNRLSGIPKVLETPKEMDDTPMDRVNLDLLRQYARP